MILPVEFLRGADAELQGAFNHFEEYREGFGMEFMTESTRTWRGLRHFLRVRLFTWKE
jgi:hypothetical protein